MNSSATTPVQPVLQKKDEEILVVQRNILFAKGDVQGFKPLTDADYSDYVAIVQNNQQFLWRSVMEADPTYKQIIPYLIFRHDDMYFLMKRRSTASEARLKDKHSLGIGGHIRKEDITDGAMENWARREFAEEVAYAGNLAIKPLGIINDDSNEVGRVHVGFAFLLEGDSDAIQVRSELKEGQLMTLEQMDAFYDSMETWTQLVFTYLKAMSLPGDMLAQGSVHESAR